MARLRQLPEVLDKTDTEIAETCGVSTQVWSNYKSESGSDSQIRPLVALELEKAYGIPMAWVYGGLTEGCRDSDLRQKLTLANRKAAAWLASRYPRRRGPGAHIAILMLAGGLLLVGCAEAGHTWKRLDGLAVASERIEADKLACKGEAAKANLSAGREAVLAPDTFGWSGGMRAVYFGCMAEKGYLRDSP